MASPAPAGRLLVKRESVEEISHLAVVVFLDAGCELEPLKMQTQADGRGSILRGHAHITLTTYAHAIPRERQGAGDALARLMGQSGNKMETLTPETGLEVGQNIRQVIDLNDIGEVAERLNAPVLKTGVGAIRPWVRIPPSPPKSVVSSTKSPGAILDDANASARRAATRKVAAISPSPPNPRR